MESELRPRDIQARIRAGASVEELANDGGMSATLVERFAGPVLAERGHMAATAMASPIRRGGDSSAHRPLRLVVSERLNRAGVDLDAVEWDSRRITDGRWVVTAAYLVDDEPRVAEFLFQPSGRFSVSYNDEARGLAAEKPWPPVGEGAPDDEPTVDLADELALVRALQATEVSEPAAKAPEPWDSDTEAPVTEAPVTEAPVTEAPVTEAPVAETPVAETPATETPAAPEVAKPSGRPRQARTRKPRATRSSKARKEPEPTPPAREESIAAPEFSEDGTASQLDRLFAMFDDEHAARVAAAAQDDATEESTEDTGPVYAGLSDAAAIPEVEPGGELPAATVSELPVEPSLFDDDPRFAVPAEEPPAKPRRRNRKSGSDATAEDDSPSATEEVSPTDASAATKDEPVATVTDEATDEIVSADASADDATEAEEAPAVVEEAPAETEEAPAVVEESPAPEPAPRKRKGRASVPSWDEIMFGSPRRR